MESKQKRTWGIMLIRIFILRVINNGRKILAYHEIIGRIVEQILSVISQVWKESKL